MIRAWATLLIIMCTSMSRAQYDNPRLWQFEELQKLGTQCVRSWSFRASKKGGLERDSMLMSCMCYDTAAKRLDWVEYVYTPVRKHGSEVWGMVEGHRQFLWDGQEAWSVELRYDTLQGLAKASGSLQMKRMELDSSQKVVRRVEAYFMYTTFWNIHEQPPDHVDPTWSIDSLECSGDRLVRVVKHGRFLPEPEISLFTYSDGMRRQVTYFNGNKTRSTTWLPDAVEPIWIVDSVFIPSPSGAWIGRRIQEERSGYADHRMVDHEMVDWTVSWASEGARNSMAIYEPEAWMVRPPMRARHMFTYQDTLLHKEVSYTEAGHALDSTVYHYENGLFVRSSLPTPRASRRSDGLPIEYWPEQHDGGLFCYRFEYTNERQSVVRGAGLFNWVKTYEPH